MEVHGLKMLPIVSLKLPGDFRKRVQAPHVIELGKSMEEVGQLNEPWVRTTDKLLIAGCDRVAAHIARGLEKVLVKLVECTDEEAERVKLWENAGRRHEPERQALDMERLLAIESAQAARQIQKAKQNGGAPPPEAITEKGREKKPQRMAREKIARQRGLTYEGVRTLEKRAKKRLEKREKVAKVVEAQAEGKPVDTAPISPIDDLGFELDAQWLLKVAEVKRLTELAAQRASDALGALTQLSNRPLPFSESRLQGMRRDAQQLAHAIRSIVPSSLCPFCKGQDAYQTTCTACVAQGYITAGQMDHVPEELWAQDKVSVDGKIRQLEVPEPEPTLGYEQVTVQADEVEEPELGTLEDW